MTVNHLASASPVLCTHDSNNNQFALNLFVFQYVTCCCEHVGPLGGWAGGKFLVTASYCYGIVKKKRLDLEGMYQQKKIF